MTIDRDFIALQELNQNQHFLKLKEKFCAVNQRSNEFQARDPEAFFKLHARHILLLMSCMGDEAAIKWLSDQLAKTVLSLERLLSTLPECFPQILIVKLRAIVKFNHYFKSDQTQLGDWKSILTNLSSILQHKISDEVDDALILVLEPCEIKSVAKKVNDYLLGRIYDQLAPDPATREKINTDKILESISLEYFSLLAFDRQLVLDCDPHQPVFAELLDRYLKGESIYDFLHDVTQSSEEEKNIARHNLRIRHFLRKKGINPLVALHYPKVLEFEYRPEGFDLIDRKKSEMQACCLLLQRLCVVADDELTLLEHQKTGQNKEVWPSINEIKQKIQDSRKWSKHFLKDEKPPLMLYEASHFEYLKKVIAMLEAVSGNTYLGQQWLSISEMILKKFVEIQKCAEIKKYPKTKLKPTRFRIEQWNKEKITTLFLGNEVGCCLAIGGEYSVEILRRIMDDAFLMHVVIDAESEKPVALTWLYLAIDALEEVNVVANFIEIKNKFGDEVHARKYIVNALLDFTGSHYLRDNPGIKRFFIAQPDYGYNYFLSFPVERVALIDKVGGAYCPSDYDHLQLLSRRSRTCRLYYLQSMMKAIKQLFVPLYCYQAPDVKQQPVDPLNVLVQSGLGSEQLLRWLADFMMDTGGGFDKKTACALYFLVNDRHFSVSDAVAEIRGLSPYALPVLAEGYHLGFTGDFLRTERLLDAQLIAIERLMRSDPQLDLITLIRSVKKSESPNSPAFGFFAQGGVVEEGDSVSRATPRI